MLFFACSAMVLLAGAYVLTPLFKEPKGNLEVELLAETELDRLLNRKAVVYSNIKDLEFEYKMGRLSDADFRRLEAGYKNEAALILQKLDQLGAEKNIDESIEKDIAARKSRLFPSSLSASKDSQRCPSCGAEVIAGKKFCADCGHRL
jgi:rRNA maturation endonuclease Nob1